MSPLKLLLLLICIGAETAAAENSLPAKSLDDVCKQVVCRPPTKIRLDMGQQRFYVVDQPRAPFVYDGVINVLADETVSAAGHTTGEDITDLSYAPDPSKAGLLIVARLQQTNDSQSKLGMVLTINNPFDRPLAYKAYIQPAGKNEFSATPVCPVPPGRISAETWPYPVVQILLREFRFLGKNESLPLDCNPLPAAGSATR